MNKTLIIGGSGFVGSSLINNLDRNITENLDKNPSSFFNKLWIFTLFLYLSEIMFNSTHGLKNICFILGLISVVESLFIVFKKSTDNIDNE